ncbi:MAG TPA: DUF4412 domain-containing protein [Nitrospira sp.]|nr:DUF4412 domain-containing protein [Nitrospira sp.]
MRKRWPLVVVGFVLALTPLASYAGDFEGVLHMNANHAGTGSATSMDWYLKGEKARMEMSRKEGQKQVLIFDGKTRTMQMAMPGQNTYMEMSLEGERGEHLREAFDRQTVERTGKKDKIAGYTCEVWRISDKDDRRLKSEICVAKGFGKAATFWVDPKEVRRSSQPSWVKQLIEEGGFGLRSIQYDETGKETTRMEVTSIEKKSLDQGLFAFPSDWTKRDLSAIQEGMKAMRDPKGQGGADMSTMIEDMKKRRAERRKAREAPGEDEPQQDLKEMMKQLGEAMKKQQQQQGGQ